jgi:hypothetical protein
MSGQKSGGKDDDYLQNENAIFVPDLSPQSFGLQDREIGLVHASSSSPRVLWS